MKNGARFCLGSGRRMANEPNTARWSRPSLVMRKVKSKVKSTQLHMHTWLGGGGPRGTAAGGPVRRKARAQQINTENQRTTLRALEPSLDRHAARTPPEADRAEDRGTQTAAPGPGAAEATLHYRCKRY